MYWAVSSFRDFYQQSVCKLLRSIYPFVCSFIEHICQLTIMFMVPISLMWYSFFQSKFFLSFSFGTFPHPPIWYRSSINILKTNVKENKIVLCYSSLFHFGAGFAQEGREGRVEKRELGHVILLVWQQPFGSEQRNQLFTILGEWGWLVATSIFSKGTLFISSSTHWNRPSPAFWHLGRGRRCLCWGPVLTGRNVLPGDLLILTFCCHCF